jgi:hypothetical protein
VLPSVTPTRECLARKGGAIVGFEVNKETFAVWTTNSKFIDEAIQFRDEGTTKLPMFNKLLDKRDCDAQWSWHTDPAAVEFVQKAIEVCDGRPSDVEKNKAEWLKTVKRYCPWNAKVVSVDDRRRPPSDAQIAAEAKRQQKGSQPMAANVATLSQSMCAGGAVPSGWILVNDQWNPTSCGNPTSIVYNVWIIDRYDDKPVGSVMSACAAAPTPSGWIIVNTQWNPTTCGHPTSIVNNVKQIRRVN